MDKTGKKGNSQVGLGVSNAAPRLSEPGPPSTSQTLLDLKMTESKMLKGAISRKKINKGVSHSETAFENGHPNVPAPIKMFGKRNIR